MRVGLPVERVGPCVVLGRVGVGLLGEVFDVRLDRRTGRIAREPSLRRRGEEVGQAVLERDQLRLRLVPDRWVVRGQPARVGEQRRHVVGPQPSERGGGLIAEQRPDHRGQIVRVAGDRDVRGLPEVVVVADAAAHQVRRKHRVLPQQRLELQRLVGGRLAGRDAQGAGSTHLPAHLTCGGDRHPMQPTAASSRIPSSTAPSRSTPPAARNPSPPPATNAGTPSPPSPGPLGSDPSSMRPAPPLRPLTCVIVSGDPTPGRWHAYAARPARRLGPTRPRPPSPRRRRLAPTGTRCPAMRGQDG